MTTANTIMNDAERILVPSGRDYIPCAEAASETFGFEIPTFKGRGLTVVTEGRTFVQVKGKDVPRLVAGGYADIGFTGTDVCVENADLIRYEEFGSSMCSYNLLGPIDEADSLSADLRRCEDVLPVATSLPRLLGRCAAEQNLNLVPAGVIPSGSVEAMVSLGISRLVADVVQTGNTAADNGLVTILKLRDLYPVVVWGSEGSQPSKAPNQQSVDEIDGTLDRRSAQIDDEAATSYTLELLRDPNRAGKKVGEETGELMMAIFGDGDTEACESEIADMIYAALVAARSQDKPARLGNVLALLANRNTLTTIKLENLKEEM